MIFLLVEDLLVAVDRKVVILRDDVGLVDAKALLGAGALAFLNVTFYPARENVGEVVLGVLLAVRFLPSKS